MRPRRPPPAPAATASATRAASPKSDAKRSSSGGQDAASADPATAAISTRVSSTTASPSRASSATSSAGEERAISAARIDRGACPGAARRAHPALLDDGANAAGGLGLEQLPGRRRHAPGDHQLGCAVPDHRPQRVEVRHLQRPIAGQPRHLQESAHGAVQRPNTVQAGRQPQEREVERRVDVEPRPGGGTEVAPLPARVVQRARRRVVGRACSPARPAPDPGRRRRRRHRR